MLNNQKHKGGDKEVVWNRDARKAFGKKEVE
jgi:hypothetical protein